ncbi:CRISPR-associated endonuclease Cas1 [uncultured Friedmanniella sp.]|uniref:CRISPR-associated endonuclease Cas4g/Cas1g n=1 Tax=uncultured Friedmanniella sp. TaxID=335381 RepID=UPI0035C958ED
MTTVVDPAQPDALPELLPARMLNEFVYCQRLFYLEWVDHRWADNEDTAQGRFAHRRVDQTGPALPPPAEMESFLQAHSVQIENAELGLVAVIDRVDHSDGTVSPVDIKKGSPTPDGQAWPADEMQLLVQAVLLREAGYQVESAALYYVAANRRVEVSIPADVMDRVSSAAIEARQVAARPSPPLPLVDSPKCPRCSLAGLCLPDEVNAALERSDQMPRRIVPRDPDHRPIYVTEQGALVGIKGGRLVVKLKQVELASVRLIDVSQLCVFGHVQISTEALSRLWARGVPTLWFSYGGWLNGWAQGEMSRYVELRRRQVINQGAVGIEIATLIIAGKIRNSRTLLMRNAKTTADSKVIASLKELEQRARSASSRSSLLGYEGTAARLYFEQFSTMLNDKNAEVSRLFDVNGRNRRPPRDPINCLLSFCYSLLVKDLVATCIGVGLDPYIGVLHSTRFGRPSLALDLQEEFRPLIGDSVVIQVLNNGEITAKDFVVRSRGVMLTPEGRRTVIAAYERRLDTEIRHPKFGYKISYRRVLDVQARLLAATLIGELSSYIPMTTR